MSEKARHALVVDDQENWRKALRTLLEPEGMQVSEAKSFKEAMNKLDHSFFDLVVLDVRLMDEETYNVEGLGILHYIKKHHPATKSVVITGYPEIIGNKKPPEADAFIHKIPEKSSFVWEFKNRVGKLLQN